MKTYVPLTLLLACSASLLTAAPLGTAFTYQGKLADAGQPADGVYDFRFAIYDAATDGAEVGGPLTNTAVVVSNGLFTRTLDFGESVFTGDARWLEIGVRLSGGGAFAALTPRQPVTSTPYALSAGSVPGGTITTAMLANGAVTAAKIAPGAVSQLGTPSGADTDAVQVTNGGLVGVGTDTPQAGLHLTTGRDLFAPTWLAELVDNRGSWTNLAGDCRVAVSGNLLALSSFANDALTLVNISNPAAPVSWWSAQDGSGPFTNLNGASGLALSGSLLAVAARDEDAVTLVDVSNPATPVWRAVIRDGIGGFNDLDGAVAVDLTGNLLVVAALNDHAVTLVDVQNPTSPTLLGLMKDGFNDFNDLGGAAAVARQGNLLAIAGSADNAVTLVDIGQPSAPGLLSTLRNGSRGFTNLTGPVAVALSGDLLAIAAYTDNAVTLVDVSDPSSPVRLATLRDGVGGFNALAGAAGVLFQGDLLWIAANAELALTAVDVSRPTAPVLKGVLRDGFGRFAHFEGLRSLALSGSTVVAGAFSAVTLLEGAPVQVGLASEGWVGIGTTTPAAALHVVGNLTVEGAGVAQIQAAHVELGASTANGNYATAMGNSTATGSYASAAGKALAAGDYATALGDSTASGDYSLAAGRQTVASGVGSVALGVTNTASGDHSVAAGQRTTASGMGSVALGTSNTVSGDFSTIAGGRSNTASSVSSFVGSGLQNSVGPDAGFSGIVAGLNNSIGSDSTNSFIGAGRGNVIETLAPESVIVGGVGNSIISNQRSAFIGGGARNEIRLDNQHAVIVGGRDNRIGTNTVISLVVGGGENVIGNNVDGGLMVGGFRNDILGSPNPDRREIAPILLGGSDNEIGRESSWAVILGGDNNRIGTNCASAITVGGTNNLVADNCGFSFAAGRRSRVNHFGAFVWADSQNASFASAGVNTFNIRAEGGVHLNGDTSQFFGSTTRQMLNLYGDGYGIGVQSSTLYQRSNYRFSWFLGGVHSNTQNDPGAGGLVLMTLTSGGLTVNGTFVSASDRNQKENIRPVDPREVLEKVAALPIAEWNFKTDTEARHVGPMAQDFRAAFGLGTDDKHIATVDADGVALAAIQGLNQRLNEKDAEIQELKRVVAELQAALLPAAAE